MLKEELKAELGRTKRQLERAKNKIKILQEKALKESHQGFLENEERIRKTGVYD